MARGSITPSPAGWYDDPYEFGARRYFDGTGWTDRTDETGTQTAVAPIAPDQVDYVPNLPVAPSTPRPAWLRVVLFVALLVANWLVHYPISRIPHAGLWLGYLLTLGLLYLAAPLVSYRRRDAFWAVIPFYAAYLMVRVAWRLTLWPYRNWAPRPDEAFDWQQLRHPRGSGEIVYLTKKRFADRA